MTRVWRSWTDTEDATLRRLWIKKAGRPQGEAAKSWYRSRAEARDYPAERGWCSGLGATEEQAKRGTTAGWRFLCGVLRNVIAETDAAWTAERAAIVRAKGEG